jgi:hypothetical protein
MASGLNAPSATQPRFAAAILAERNHSIGGTFIVMLSQSRGGPNGAFDWRDVTPHSPLT